MPSEHLAPRATLPEVLRGLYGIGFGGAPIGNLYAPTDDDTVFQALQTAWDLGVRYFDTAPHYGLGLSEERLGKFLAEKPRADFIVSTKVGRVLTPNPDYRPGDLDNEGFAVPATTLRRWDPSAEGVRASLEASLERMGLDYVDIVFLHDPDVYDLAAGLSQGIPALRQLQQDGLTTAIGVGTNDDQAAAQFAASGELDVVMIAGRYTLAEQPAETSLFPICARTGTQILPVGVFNSGLLARNTVPDNAKHNYHPAPPRVIAHTRKIAQVCREYDTALPQAALQFPTRHPLVPGIVMGASKPEHIVQNITQFHARTPALLWDELAAQQLTPPPPDLLIDTHMHIWDPAQGYSWLKTAPPELSHTYDIDQAVDEAIPTMEHQGILVQAEDSYADTRRMLQAAKLHPSIVGVVGWLPLADPQKTAHTLAHWRGEPLFVGMRHLVHDDPDPQFLLRAEVQESLRLLAAAGLPCDMPDAFPQFLTQLPHLSEAVPELTIVIDHLAKPPQSGPGHAEWSRWQAQLKAAAESPRTFAKVSGLQDLGKHTRAAIDYALEIFGPERLMYGSDWPMTRVHGEHQQVMIPTWDAIAQLNAESQRLIRWATAVKVYKPLHKEGSR